MSIHFGPAGLGGIKDAEANIRKYAELGFKACEIAFTYGIYIKDEENANRIGKIAKECGIQLSIHAPYWINLNSEDSEKIAKSKERILECCKVGTELGASRVVFHPGFYGKNKESAYENIKNQILELQKEIKERGYTPKLAPETMGKINVFGSVNEIMQLVEETGCDLCVDFAHVLAREKNYNFKEVFERLKKFNGIHLHFSGIEYGTKGEKNHKLTTEKEWEMLLEALPRNKEIFIINESPFPVQDSLSGLTIYRRYFQN